MKSEIYKLEDTQLVHKIKISEFLAMKVLISRHFLGIISRSLGTGLLLHLPNTLLKGLVQSTAPLSNAHGK